MKPVPFETKQFPRTMILGVYAPYNETSDIRSYYDEFVSLIKTYNQPYDQELFIRLRDIDSAYFLTKGKLQEVKELCQEHKIERIIISDTLTPKQERNLEDFLHCTILDRTGLILEIFEQAAQSAEGKKQVEIAKLRYLKTRLAGKGIHLSQQEGFTGVRGGPGETAKEKERRHIEETMHKLRKQLDQMQKVRETQRKRRLARQIPHICLIGYTNSGKSTILNALTKSNVLAENKLFATLDTTTRELYIDGQKKGILSDTVGFIQQLPPHLIDAFKSTLSELQYADLLLHVVDISDRNWETHIRVVNTILHELEVDKDTLYVFNKADKVENFDYITPQIVKYQPNLLTSAIEEEGLEDLIAFLYEWEPVRESEGSL